MRPQTEFSVARARNHHADSTRDGFYAAIRMESLPARSKSPHETALPGPVGGEQTAKLSSNRTSAYLLDIDEQICTSA